MGNLIECPVCKEVGKKQILGRLLETGELMVLRFHHGTTIIKSLEYSVVCGCGYALKVSNGGTVSIQQTI